MDCKICELHQKRFFCANCLRTKLQEHRSKLIRATKERQSAQEQAEKFARIVEAPRTLRADLYRTETRTKELAQEVDRLRQLNDASRTRVAALRTQLATRRTNLLSARSVSAMSHNTSHGRLSGQSSDSVMTWVANIDDNNYRLVQTRKSLVEELVEAFDLGESDVSTGRLGVVSNQVAPSAPGGAWNAASRFGSEFFLRSSIAAIRKPQPVLKWTISSLILPLPADVQKSVREGIAIYAVEEINTAIGHTLYFLSILCFYLGVKLPFQTRWSGGKQGVGIPYLKAGTGPASGNWSKWIMPCALYVNPSLTNGPHSNPTATEKFAIAYSMLAYNVCYLAYTQTVSIPLSQSGNILANLWTLCAEDKSIGHFSHETSSSSMESGKQAAIWPPVTSSGVGVSHPLHHDRVLAAPTPAPSEFPLDFDAVLELLVGRKVQPPSENLTPGGLVVEDEGGEGWAVVELEEDGF